MLLNTASTALCDDRTRGVKSRIFRTADFSMTERLCVLLAGRAFGMGHASVILEMASVMISVSGPPPPKMSGQDILILL